MRILIIMSFVLSPVSLLSQNQESNWFFGDSLLLTFSDTTILQQKVSGITHETSAIISDSLGNLLFYTDGKYVWNKEFEVMSNSNLDIDQYWGWGSSLTQGSIIIPNPGQSDQFYIINLAVKSVKFSIVDMSLNGGLGDIIEGKKNLPILEDVYINEKLQAVKHGNGRDWWVLVHHNTGGLGGSTNTFYEFLITPSGVEGPFEINAGVLESAGIGSVGEMIFSPDGNLLAYASGYGLQLFDFDRCSGGLFLLENIDNIEDGFYGYGCSFSPDGSKIYISNSNEVNDKIFQFCLNCIEDFPETKTLIYSEEIDGYAIGQQNLGIDGKIYFTVYHYIMPNNIYSVYNTNLFVINDPNTEGVLCNIDTASIWLGGRRATMGLPNIPNYNLSALTQSECDTIISDISDNHYDFDKIIVFPSPANDIINIAITKRFSSIEISINNLQNQKIQKINFPSTEQQIQINIHNLNPGIYTVSVKSEGKLIATEKFVKL